MAPDCEQSKDAVMNTISNSKEFRTTMCDRFADANKFAEGERGTLYNVAMQATNSCVAVDIAKIIGEAYKSKTISFSLSEIRTKIKNKDVGSYTCAANIEVNLPNEIIKPFCQYPLMPPSYSLKTTTLRFNLSYVSEFSDGKPSVSVSW